MEDTLREAYSHREWDILRSLNPCFNGRYSQSDKAAIARFGIISLNPCFNGRYSQRPQRLRLVSGIKVLILVLMEDTLRAEVTRR